MSLITEQGGTPESGAPSPLARLRMAHVSKTFGRNRVLTDAGLDVRAGEIHGLLGQNGSGKSTLIKVLSGLYRPDAGALVEIDGVELQQPLNPAQISSHGLTIIHQSLGLIPGHSVTENIRMASLSRRRFRRFIDWRYERSKASDTLAGMHSDIDPDALIDVLPMGQRATVAIARALQVITPGSGCLVLDESTQSLPREVLPEFYQILRGLASSGTSIVLVSHRLDEVLALADRFTILRDGKVAAAAMKTEAVSEAQLSRQILGRELLEFVRESSAGSAPGSGVRATGVTGRKVHDVTIELMPGEVVGVTGPTESGHEELPYLLAGVTTDSRSGQIDVDGSVHDLSTMTVPSGLAAGIVLVPSDRAGQGLAVDMSAASNLTLPRVSGRSRGGVMRSAWQDEEFEKAIAMLDITPPEPEQLVASFSGGNQQKILLAKWLLHRPKLLVLHEPTQAVDVGARADILRAIGSAAADGAAVVLSSIETEDLALVCDRVLVMSGGVVVRDLKAPFTPDDVLGFVA